MAFPTLSAKPSSINSKYLGNTISVEFDGGYEQTRERNTRLRRDFKVSYQLIERSDLNLLIAHFESVRKSEAFDWENIGNSTTYNVRYKTDLDYTEDAKYPNRFNVALELREV